jgi:exopolysaccharide production protein ExoQ
MSAISHSPINKYLRAAEEVFTVISLILYTSGVILLILTGGGGQGLNDDEELIKPIDFSLQQTIFFVNYAISAVLLLFRWKKAAFTLSKDWTIWLLMLMAVVSVFWSSMPKLTSPRSVALVGNFVFALYLSSRYSLKQQLKLLGWCFALIIGMSFLFAILNPAYGTMQIGIHAGSWRGVFVHKNVLGKQMAISGIIFMLIAMDAKEKRWIPWTGLCLSFCLLVLSRSSSSMANFLIVIALIPVYNISLWRYHWLVPGIIAVATLGGGLSFWLNQNAEILLGSVGKDPTLTGRTEMWPHILDMIWKQPWLGYGYSGFWDNWDSPAAYVWYAVKWLPPNSHNGFLDLLLELGFVGLLIFGIGFCQTIWRSLTWLRTERSWSSFWPILYLSYMILSNLGESALLSRNDIFWVLYVSILFSLAMNTSKTDKIVISN